MSGKSFLDTNVLVYLYTNDDLVKKAQALAVSGQGDIWISSQVLIEFSNVAHRKIKIGWPGIELALTEFKADFSVQLTSITTIVHATRLAQRYGLSWFDALIVAAALECGCDTLYSEDLSAGQLMEGTLRVVNPFVV